MKLKVKNKDTNLPHCYCSSFFFVTFKWVLVIWDDQLWRQKKWLQFLTSLGISISQTDFPFSFFTIQVFVYCALQNFLNCFFIKYNFLQILTRFLEITKQVNYR